MLDTDTTLGILLASSSVSPQCAAGMRRNPGDISTLLGCIEDHFVDVTEMVGIGSGAMREVEFVFLSRYACSQSSGNKFLAKKTKRSAS